MNNQVTVIIPTLNEEQAIGKVLEDMPLEAVDEVLVVDSSKDKTAEVAKSLGAKVIHQPKEGTGRAIQTGIENAKGEIVVYIDGDYTYDPREIPEVVLPILKGECDVVLGDRFGKMLPGSMDRLNKFGNRLLTSILNILFIKKVGDTQSGLRAARRRLLLGLSYHDYGAPYLTEQLIKLVKNGARIQDVPITYRPRIGNSKLRPWSDGFKILKTILRGRFTASKEAAMNC